MNVGRRRVVSAAAWSVPIIALSAPAPAFALSPATCQQPPPPASWTTTSSGLNTGHGGIGWNSTKPYQFSVYDDNSPGTASATVTTTTTISVVSGTVYSISTPIFWGYGNGVASQSAPNTVTMTIGGTTVFSYTTRSAPLSAPGSSTQTSTFTATTTGTVSLTLKFTLAPLGTTSASDDIVITAPTFTCSR